MQREYINMITAKMGWWRMLPRCFYRLVEKWAEDSVQNVASQNQIFFPFTNFDLSTVEKNLFKRRFSHAPM